MSQQPPHNLILNPNPFTNPTKSSAQIVPRLRGISRHARVWEGTRVTACFSVLSGDTRENRVPTYSQRIQMSGFDSRRLHRYPLPASGAGGKSLSTPVVDTTTYSCSCVAKGPLRFALVQRSRLPYGACRALYASLRSASDAPTSHPRDGFEGCEIPTLG